MNQTTGATIAILLCVTAGLHAEPRPNGDPVTPATSVDLVASAPLDLRFAPLVVQDPDQEAEGLPERPVPVRFGAAGSRRIYYHGGGGFRANNADEFYFFGGVGTSHFIAENLSLNIELNAAYYDQERADNGWAANVNLLFRWHFYAETNWSLYFDGGAGVMVATEEVPRKGSNFNFTPQAGIGASFDIATSTRMLVGLRWQHVSNGSLYDDNPGMDGIAAYMGVSVPF